MRNKLPRINEEPVRLLFYSIPGDGGSTELKEEEELWLGNEPANS